MRRVVGVGKGGEDCAFRVLGFQTTISFEIKSIGGGGREPGLAESLTSLSEMRCSSLLFPSQANSRHRRCEPVSSDSVTPSTAMPGQPRNHGSKRNSPCLSARIIKPAECSIHNRLILRRSSQQFAKLGGGRYKAYRFSARLKPSLSASV